MPVLPIIDLLILMGWTALAIGGVLKAVYISTSYRPTLFAFGPMDLLIMAGVFLIFALTLAARTWVKLNEPRLYAARRAAARLEEYEQQAHAEERDLALELATDVRERASG